VPAKRIREDGRLKYFANMSTLFPERGWRPEGFRYETVSNGEHLSVLSGKLKTIQPVSYPLSIM